MAAISDWHIPYHQQAPSLQTALDTLHDVTAYQQQAPLMRQWAAHLKATPVLHGGLNQQQHDCIQIVLGRGLLPTDEAFGFGFVLGSAAKGIMTEQALHAHISRYLHPMLLELAELDQAVFREGLKMAFISGCLALDRFNFNDWQEQPLRVLRDAIGLEQDLLLAYYAVEQRRYPQNRASARLLPPVQRVAAF